MEELPLSRGKSFASLDDYLAHLEEGGAIDLPYYEEVAPGRYRLIQGRATAAEPLRYFLREDLMRKYGFNR